MATKVLIIFLFLFAGADVSAQYDSTLNKVNEDIVFAFRLDDKKWVSVCKEKEDKYLVYRIGTKDKIDLQVPTVLDTTSWNRFRFNGYSRGGGKENAAMYFGYLSFGTKGIGYEVYQLWNSEDSIQHCGINIFVDDKLTKVNGDIESKKGNLVNLLYEPKIKKEDEDQ